MPDDCKRSEPLKGWFTEREMLDLVRLAEQHERRPGEMMRVIVRRYMYGNVGPVGNEIHGANGAEAARGDCQ